MNRSGATAVLWNEAVPGRYTGEGTLMAAAGGPGLPLSAPRSLVEHDGMDQRPPGVDQRGWTRHRRLSARLRVQDAEHQCLRLRDTPPERIRPAVPGHPRAPADRIEAGADQPSRTDSSEGCL